MGVLSSELWKRIKADPTVVETIYVTKAGRLNIKIKDEDASFFSVLSKRGMAQVRSMLDLLRENKVEYGVVDRVRKARERWEGDKLIDGKDEVVSLIGNIFNNKTPSKAEAEPEAEPVAEAVAEAVVMPTGNVFEYEGVQLPVNDKVHSARVQALVPADNNYFAVPEVKLALACLRHKQPLLLEGHTGVGKTEMIKWIAHKTNNPLLKIQSSEDAETSTLLGHMEVDEKGTLWVDGIVTVAVRDGFWLYVDEINAIPAGVKIALHGLLDDNRHIILADNKGERIEAHPNFRFIATSNPVEAGLYHGVGDENLAFLNRFSKVSLDYLEKKLETKILSNIFGAVDKKIIGYLIEASNAIRLKLKKGDVTNVVTTRDLQNVCRNLDCLSVDEALSMVVSKFGLQERSIVTDAFEQQLGRLPVCRKLFPES